MGENFGDDAMLTLRDADARALDLLLDRAATVRGDGAMLFAPEPGVPTEHIEAVEKILKLLHVMPAAEPASDLMRRTLDRVGNSVERLPGQRFISPEASLPVA